MNALLWVTTGIAVGWLANSLLAEMEPEAMALNMACAVAGGVLAGLMVAPTGSALPLRAENYSAVASVAAFGGAVLMILGVRALVRWWDSSTHAPPGGHRGQGSALFAHKSAWSTPLTDVGPDTGPDTVPSGRFASDGDFAVTPGARRAD